MLSCENCGRKDELYSGIKYGVLYRNLCGKCASMFTTGAVYSHAYNRRQDQREYARDILQPYDGLKPNREYIREYRKSAEGMWNDDVLREFS